MLTAVAETAFAVHGRFWSPTEEQPSAPENVPLVILPTPVAPVLPLKFAVQLSVTPFLVAEVVPVPVKLVLSGVRW